MAGVYVELVFGAGVVTGALIMAFMVRRRLRRMIRDGEI